MNKIFSHRVLGLIFIGLMVFGVWSVNAVFTQKFTDFDEVALSARTASLNLPARADVKVRGAIVGQVLKAEPGRGGENATLTLGIDPDKIGQIPDNVTAAILPKTLFGEKFVELQIPASASSKSLKDGGTISETELPVEVEQVLNDLFPLLRAVQPAELNYTLNAIATALEGRGEEIGNNIVVLDNYLKELNPDIPALLEDLRLLAQVSGTYADVTPQIAATLRNTVKTGNTLLSREEKLNAFLKDVTAFSGTAERFLNRNGDNLIRLGKLSEPQLALLARYSPSFPCLLEGIVKQMPLLANTFRGNIFHINVEVLPKQPRGYNASDRQLYDPAGDPGPTCAGLPNPEGSQAKPYARTPNLRDGVDNLQRGDNQRTSPGFDDAKTGLSAGIAGTRDAQNTINSLIAPLLRVPVDQVPGITTLLFGPLMAGTEVSVR